ncbi:hypothetical protein [Streptomyces sp. NPDC055140]
MDRNSAPGPAFTQVQLTGPAEEVARLMQTLTGTCEVIFGPIVQPARGGEVSCTAQLVSHPSPAPVAKGQSASVAVQAVLEVGPDAIPGLPSPEAVQQVEAAVSAAVSALPGVRGASSRVVSAVGLPAGRG